MGYFKEIAIKKMETNEKVGEYCVEKLKVAEKLAMCVSHWYEDTYNFEQQQAVWGVACDIERNLQTIIALFEDEEFFRDDLTFGIFDEVIEMIAEAIDDMEEDAVSVLLAIGNIVGIIIGDLIMEEDYRAFDENFMTVCKDTGIAIDAKLDELKMIMGIDE